MAQAPFRKVGDEEEISNHRVEKKLPDLVLDRGNRFTLKSVVVARVFLRTK
jgi:hypothetical protein